MKKFLVVLATLVVAINLAAFAGGDGTEGDPYQVSNLTELNDVRNYPTAHFIQTADIDLDVAPYNTGTGWVPIPWISFPDYARRFSGTYDGGGHIIDNLYLNSGTTQQMGLFGSTNAGAVIKNLGVTNVNVTGQITTGALLGFAYYSATISNCYSTGSVTATNSSYGGLIGAAQRTILSDCYSTASVSGPANQAGGLLGQLRYAEGSMTNCYSAGLVSASGASVGGLVGYSDAGTTISDCFWDTQTSGQTTSAVGTGKTTAEMKQQATFTNWDFTTTWDIDGVTNNGYPFLIFLEEPTSDFPAGDNTDVGGSTTINPSVDLNYAADQTIPPIPNPSFVADYEVVLSGTGIVDITISTSYMFGSIYQNGSWDTVGNSGGIIFFENVDFDAKGDSPIVLGDEDAALPVTLSSFTATFNGNSSILQWATQSEVNNAGWNVYRAESEDFSFANKLNPEMIHGAGTTSELTEYSYADESGFEHAATYYYWLESVDYANVTNLHGPINVEIPEQDNPDAPEIVKIDGIQSIYPNPFNPTTTISYYLSETSEVNLEIYNVKGQKIYSQILNQESEGMHYFKWNGTDFQNNTVTSGIYFIKLKTTNSNDMKKVILMK
jgi:hypothetical protein